METKIPIYRILESAVDALSTGHTNKIRYSFVVQYQNPTSLVCKSEYFEAFTIQGYKKWFVTINQEDHFIGEFPDFWKPNLIS